MAEKTDKSQPRSLDFEKNVKVDRTIPNDLSVQYTDGMVVKNQDGLFNLYFFQNRWPLAITQDDLDAIDEIESRCIAHLVMTPEQMKKNIDALVENFNKFESRILKMIEAAKMKGQTAEDE